VKEVALHLLGGEIGNLSRRRDAFSPPSAPISLNSWGDTVAFINDLNDRWLIGARRISPRLLCDLLALTAPQFFHYLASLDPMAMGGAVSWAGTEPAPVWLDIAREYTERWYHQQQIRDAVGKPGYKQPHYFAPVLAAFVHALPLTFRDAAAPDGTVVSLVLSGDSGGAWSVVKKSRGWTLYSGVVATPDAQVTMDQDVAWRLFTRGMSHEDALSQSSLLGDQALALKIFEAVSIIA